MHRYLLSAVLVCSVMATWSARADEPATQSPVIRAIAQEDTRTLFLRCCWALGRAGFHYCVQYGVCKSDSEATCEGVGAAEGMTTSCATEPPDLPDSGG